MTDATTETTAILFFLVSSGRGMTREEIAGATRLPTATVLRRLLNNGARAHAPRFRYFERNGDLYSATAVGKQKARDLGLAGGSGL